MQIGTLNVSIVVDQIFAENTYIAHLEGENRCLVFDPGLDPVGTLRAIDDLGVIPDAILNTHGHSDHIAGNGTLKERWPDCPLVVGSGDAVKLTNPELNLSAQFGVPLISPEADVLVDEPDVYSAGGMDLEVLHTPGHSPGHVVFVWKGESPWVVFGGDVLFQGSIGRTDFPDGSFEDLKTAIHQKLFPLPDDTIVLPGHGPATTIGEEKRTNPFVGAPAGYVVSS